MRRPRTKLQVSTFPFLAVLLCAMGSLLLLLFMMDRRAKIAAQHQVAALHAQRKQRTQDEEATRTAEWEKARERLRQTLLAQQGQLDYEANGIHGALDEASKKMMIIFTRHDDLKKAITHETAKIGDIQLVIVGQQTGLNESTRNETASKKELLDAARELAELEVTFHALKALKAKATPTYSLVPYRGKHGDDRKPIYVECVAEGVLFHPDRKPLAGPEFTIASFRAEVERHAGALVAAKQVSAKDRQREAPQEKTGPYVLFLVRPTGIGSYYKASGALAGFQLDFGYELVDPDWVLDFNGDPNAKPGQPLQVAWPQTPPKIPAAPGAPFGNSPGVGFSPLGGSPGIGLYPGGLPPTGGNPGKPSSTGVIPPFSSGQGPAFVPTSKSAPPVPIASTQPNGPPGYGGSPGSGTPNPGGQSGAPMGFPNPGGGQPGDGQPRGGKPGVSPINVPIPGNNVGGQQRPSEGSSDPQDDGQKFGTPLPFATEPKRKSPSPAARTIGERDFIITIDCFADRVSVLPGATVFRWTGANAPATDQAFVSYVTSLIAKRQASVRPGEQPYRPVIRFLVNPGGSNMCYHTYPLLERLGLPMTRENVQD